MANTLGIPERTLAQISSSSNSINVIGGTDGRKSVYEPLVCRITDHVSNVGAEVGTDTSKMAIFQSRAHGHPWLKQDGVLATVIIEADADPVENPTPTNVTCLYPNFDYSTFS